MSTRNNLSNLSVIVVTYNNRDQARQLVEKLNKLHQSGAEILVADNASKDRTYEELIKYSPKFKPFLNKTNLGFSRAVNKLLKEARRDFVLLLNPDAFISSDQAKKLIDAQIQTGAAAVVPSLIGQNRKGQASVFKLPTVLGAIKKYFGGVENAFGKYRPNAKSPLKIEAGVMAVMLLPRSTINTVGYLDERYFLYFEDLDYCRRIKKAGLNVWYIPSIKVLHQHGASGKSQGDIVSQHLINSSEIYHGRINNLILNMTLRLGQKWQKLLKKIF